MSDDLALENWLAKYTFPCPRLGTETSPARITPEQCERNRNMPEACTWHSGGTERGRPPACKQCAETGMWQIYQAGDIPKPPRAAKTEPKPKQEKQEVSMPTGYKACPNCSENINSASVKCKHCGYDYVTKSAPDQERVQQVVQEQEAKPVVEGERQPILDNQGKNGMLGRRVIQLHYSPDDPKFLQLEATARRYMVEPSKVVHWVLEGVPFEMAEPEQAEA